MIAEKLIISFLCVFLTLGATAMDTELYTPWNSLGNSELDFSPILQELEIDSVEALSPDDPKFASFMEKVKEKNAEGELNEELNDSRIKIMGFIAPLEISDIGIDRFLLVPYEGACIHVPAPPVNQTILVNPKDPIPLEFYYEAVAVKGTIFVDRTDTDLAQAGYRIEADNIEVIPMEKVFENL